MISKEDLISIFSCNSKKGYTSFEGMAKEINKRFNTLTPLDSEVEEALKIMLNLKIPTYEDATFTPLEYKNAFNTIRQAFINMQEEIALLKRDVANNKTIRKEAIRLGKKRLQNKLDRIEELFNRVKWECILETIDDKNDLLKITLQEINQILRSDE